MAKVRINRFLAACGIASRRNAEKIIRQGRVQINGRITTDLAVYVDPDKDVVTVDGKPVKPFPYRIYILLNKPKDTLTTRYDPRGRKTVYDLLPHQLRPHVVPAGRLDRNTTGILILSNDGELIYRLTHPRYKVPKVYHVKTDKPVTKNHMKQLVMGVQLEDGTIASAESVFWISPDRKEIEITIVSGKYRVVRRMLEALGYRVKKLDRVAFGPIKVKRVSRGKWRFLTWKEIKALYNAVGLKVPADLREKVLMRLPFGDEFNQEQFG